MGGPTTNPVKPLKSRKARILRHRPLVDLEITGRLVGGVLIGKPFMPKTHTRNEKLPLNEEAVSAGVGTLKPHPLTEEIYADDPNAAFVNNVRSRGIIEPLIVTAENVILAGRRRWNAAKTAGIKEVPIRKVEIHSEVEKTCLILDSNLQRQKSVEQRLREFDQYLTIEKKGAGSRRGQRTDLRKNSSTSPAGRARDLAARKVGFSGAHAEIGLKVLHELDARRDSKDDTLSRSIREALNKHGIHAAHREVIDAGWMTKAAATRNTASHQRASQRPRASRATKTQPSEEEDSTPSPSIVKCELLTQIQREAVRNLERFDGAQLRDFLAELSALKSTWLNKQEAAAHV